MPTKSNEVLSQCEAFPGINTAGQESAIGIEKSFLPSGLDEQEDLLNNPILLCIMSQGKERSDFNGS
jgi:hypothetical protein